LQYKESEARLKQLKDQREALEQRADAAGQEMLQFESQLAAADEKRKGLRKQLAQVRAC
jgi:predicted  nucleic acid-binding Zn-ribbon protein